MQHEGGVTALGVPIGSDAFVREAMRQKSQGAQDKVNCVKARLAEYSKQDFRILLVRCLREQLLLVLSRRLADPATLSTLPRLVSALRGQLWAKFSEYAPRGGARRHPRVSLGLRRRAH